MLHTITSRITQVLEFALPAVMGAACLSVLVSVVGQASGVLA